MIDFRYWHAGILKHFPTTLYGTIISTNNISSMPPNGCAQLCWLAFPTHVAPNHTWNRILVWLRWVIQISRRWIHFSSQLYPNDCDGRWYEIYERWAHKMRDSSIRIMYGSAMRWWATIWEIYINILSGYDGRHKVMYIFVNAHSRLALCWITFVLAWMV